MKPNDPEILYVSADCFHPWANFRQPKLWKLSDVKNPNKNLIIVSDMTQLLPTNGDTLHAEKFEIAVSRQDPSAVFVATTHYDTAMRTMIWKSMDIGNTWEKKYEFFSGAMGIDQSKMKLLISPTIT